jgi:hypothetical protein
VTARRPICRLSAQLGTIFLGVGDEPGAHAVQINVRGHSLAKALRRLDEGALETLGPQRAETIMGLVEPTVWLMQ